MIKNQASFMNEATKRSDIKPTPVATLDAFAEDFFSGDLAALNTEFDDWQTTDGKGYHQLWMMLGRVYELSWKIDQSTSARESLEGAVRTLPDVRKSNRWRAEKKSSKELLLTLLLGLDGEKKSTKSQWAGALKAGEVCEIPPNQIAYFEWLKEIGGVQAARKIIALPKPIPDLAKLIRALGEIAPEQQTVLVPEPMDSDDFTEQFGVVIVKRRGGLSEVVPVVTLANEKLLIKAIQTYLTADKKSENNMRASLRLEEKRMRDEAMVRWEVSVKELGDYESFESYLEACALDL